MSQYAMFESKLFITVVVALKPNIQSLMKLVQLLNTSTFYVNAMQTISLSLFHVRNTN